MKCRNIVLLGLFSILILYLARPAYADLHTPAHRPNIVLILLDDLDSSDVGAYGGQDIATTAMDQLAEQGMRFTQFYANGPVCSPTRASIVTGQYPARYGIKRAVVKDSFRGIPAEVTTLAEMLQHTGYRTAHMGKWHIGTNKPEFLPTRQGFDHSVRLVGHSYTEYELSIDDRAPRPDTHNRHLTKALTDHALAFIDESVAGHPEKPFFLNLWYFAPHDPIQVPDEFDNAQTKYCLDCEDGRGRFAALVTYVDRQIQRVLDRLRRAGILDDTLVIIASDNGGTKGWHRDLPWRKISGYKASLFEGGIRVPMIAHWPKAIPAKSVNDSLVASFDLFPTIADIIGTDATSYALDGESFYGALIRNQIKTRKTPLFWENKRSNRYFSNGSGTMNTYAVRYGDWKLLFSPATRPYREDTLSLYNIRRDRLEQDDLLRTALSSKTLEALGYRLTLSREDPRVDGKAGSYDVLVNRLQYLYYRWRHNIGAIHYRATPSAQGVDMGANGLDFRGGVATVGRDPRLDFNDGDFTFATEIVPKQVDNAATIAEKPHSWRLYIDESGTLRLEVTEQVPADPRVAEGDTVVLTGPRLTVDTPYHIAFTVFGWRDSQSSIRLYVNGALSDELSDGASVSRVNAFDESDTPMLYLGNNEDLTRPYYGYMKKPLLSALSLYPGEILFNTVRWPNPYASIGLGAK